MVSRPLEYQGPFSEDVYRERALGWRRTFVLSGDRLVIHSKQFLGTESEHPVSLRGVDPVHAITRYRSPIASWGALFLGAIFASLVVPRLFGEIMPNRGGITIDAGLAILCFVTGLLHLPKIESYTFRGDGVEFGIARRGADRAHFDAFVLKLIARIKELERDP